MNVMAITSPSVYQILKHPSAFLIAMITVQGHVNRSSYQVRVNKISHHEGYLRVSKQKTIPEPDTH